MPFPEITSTSQNIFSSSMNVRISPSSIQTDEAVEKFVSIIEAYFELNGKEIQINPIDTAILKDAQIHPEKYIDLSVKVSGYSARFIDLSRSLQNDIIERTLYSEL